MQKASKARQLTRIGFSALAAFAAISTSAFAQDTEPVEHSFVLEIAPAAESNLGGDKSSSFGGSIGIEVTPIENLLELEFGLSRLGQGDKREYGGDILFKKPFRLSHNIEFMVGMGPQWGRKFSGEDKGTSHALEFAVDLMVWTTKDVGWYVEPSYGYGLGNSKGARSVGVAGGLLIGW
jgi:hypothetical protein